MDNDETVPVEGYKCTAQFKRQNVRTGGVGIYEKNNATIRVETSVQQCLVNGQNVMVVTVYVISKSVKNIYVLARRSCKDMPFILVGDFNVNVKDTVLTMPNLWSS
jgi:hypothetical protein